MAAINSRTDRPRDAQQVVFEYVRPGGRHSTFAAHLLHADHDVVIMAHTAHPSKPLYHQDKAVIESGYDVVWFLFRDQPYDIGRFYRPDGTWTGYYIDILEPVQWRADDSLSIAPLVDLALDLWLAPDGSYQVLDEDEYAAFVERGDLTPVQAVQARSALSDLISSLEHGSFPPKLVQHFRGDSH